MPLTRIRALDRRRPALALALVGALLAGLLVGPLTGGPALAADKIDPDLAAALAEDPDTPFWVRFHHNAELGGAAATPGRAARATAVVQGLMDAARAEQAEAIAKVSAAGADHRAFWASNTIYVTGGSPELAASLASEGEVSRLHSDKVYELPELVEVPAVAPVDSAVATPVEWGIAAIGADRVWADYQSRGDGVVIGSIDSGAQYDHPGLRDSYRGARADGSYDHNYNWFDPSQVCGSPSLTPCDGTGHGTHTIGTMTGGEGPRGGIGVAPGAKWISAKGCETITCSQFALLESAQWMLAPTDLSGQNPRPELHPDIINNSWGNSNGIAVEPWYQDSVNAWLAAGIFPVFSNGNAGPGCDTAGSPGDYHVSYAVGAHDQAGEIAAFSSRGRGEDGEVKPNLAAPGVSVRSARPGGSYGNSNGTSMAAPHVSGTVALIWSAAPRVAGDIPATRALLDETAVDVEDLSCGGTAADNNVWGEGTLDAYAAVTAAPRENTGLLAGTVTEAGTGAPIAGASVHVTGALDRDLVTGPDGAYQLRLVAGEYTVAASAFGYLDASADATVTAGATTRADLDLTPAPTVTVDGTVTDGSGHGWPLYAMITAEEVGSQAGPWFTDPVTGRYEITLPESGSYTLLVEPVLAGYQPVTAQVPFTADGSRDVSVPVTPERCQAPGYAVTGHYQSFETTERPEGWTVVNHTDDGGWEFDDPDPLGNRTLGGEANFASANSQFIGFEKEQDTELISPTVNLTGVAAPVLQAEIEYRAPRWTNSTGSIDVSIDDGTSWESVWSRANSTELASLSIPIPMAANQPRVKVRFHYRATFDQWWIVDDVLIGDPSCRPVDGGLVVGQVEDRTAGGPLAGTTVAVPSGAATRSAATVADPDTGDGLYILFSPQTGEVPITAAHDRFTSRTETVTVEPDTVTEAGFRLGAGRLEVSQASVSATVPYGASAVRELTLANTGHAPVTVATAVGGDGATAPSAASTATPPATLAGTAATGQHPLRTVAVEPVAGFVTSGTAALPGTAVPAPVVAGTNTGEGWQTLTPYPTGTMSPVAAADAAGRIYTVGGFDGERTTANGYVYDPVAESWSSIARLRVGRQAPASGFIDGKLYVTGGWSESGTLVPLTEVYDPQTDRWSPAANAPHGFGGSGAAVLDGKLYVIGGCAESNGSVAGDCGRDQAHVYDPAADRWTAIARYPVEVAWLSCGGIGGALYCAGGMSAARDISYSLAYRYDPVYDHWSPIADLPEGAWGSSYHTGGGQLLVSGGIRGGTTGGSRATNAGYAYHPATDTWSELPATKYPLYRAGAACGMTIVGGAHGGFPGQSRVQTLAGYEDCGAGGVAWARTDRATFTLQPGQSTTVQVRFDARELAQPGDYQGTLQLVTDSPYRTTAVPLALAVTPRPTWAQVAVTVQARRCDGTTVPLPEAYLEIDGQHASLARRTDPDGRAGGWLPVNGRGELTLIASKDGFGSATVHERVTNGSIREVTLVLRPAGGCPGR